MGAVVVRIHKYNNRGGFYPPPVPEKIRIFFEIRAWKASGRLVHQPGEDQYLQVNGLFAFECLGEDAQGALDVPLDRMQGDVEPFGDFPVLQPLEPGEEKHFGSVRAANP